MINTVTGQETVESVVNRLEQGIYEQLTPYLDRAGFDTWPKYIALLVFKEEQKVEIYGRNASTDNYVLIKEYPFTAYSGNLGPKLREGDKQIPEGLYEIDFLNPNSSFHLSLKVNYPNEFDISKSSLLNVSDMGGDIFLHGKAVTVGCIPVGDSAIEEIFLLAAKSFHNRIPVIISPRDFRINNNFPEIENIEWEEELYKNIQRELLQYKK